jgi:hypothetical protein
MHSNQLAQNWSTTGAPVSLKVGFCASAPVAPVPYRGRQLERRTDPAPETSFSRGLAS